MEWIKLEKATARKAEVLRIATLLQIHPDHAVGLCVRFWCWCDDNMAPNGKLDIDSSVLDAVLGTSGFSQALLSVDWLQVRSGSLVVPRSDRHLSQSAKSRALAAERQSKSRKAKQDKPPKALLLSQKSVTDVTKICDQRREEEKRVEERREEKNIPSSTPSKKQTSSSYVPPAGWEEVEGGLRRLGVSLVKQAIESAIDHRFTAPQVVALVAYLETNPAGCQSAKGAIYNRLVAQAADAVDWDADQNWPWSEAGTKTGEAYPVPQAKPIDRQAELDKQRARIAEQDRLIQAHASTLAGLGQDELDQLIAEAPDKSRDGLRKMVYAKGRDSPLVYLTLLELLDRRQVLV